MPERNGTGAVKFRRFAIVLAATANLVLADAVTKELAAGYLKGGPPLHVVPGFFNLAYVENRGCAWGMFQGSAVPLALFGVLALCALVWKRKTVFSPGENADAARRFAACAAECLAYAGIVGNIIDRVFRGYVIDFIDLHTGGAWHFPCFNLADICITLAAACLIAISCGEGKDREKQRKATDKC